LGGWAGLWGDPLSNVLHQAGEPVVVVGIHGVELGGDVEGDDREAALGPQEDAFFRRGHGGCGWGCRIGVQDVGGGSSGGSIEMVGGGLAVNGARGQVGRCRKPSSQLQEERK
jgi:hypothetical protein